MTSADRPRRRRFVRFAAGHAARISPSGVPARLVWLALERRYELVVSPLLLDEVAEALLRKKAGLDRADVDEYVARLGECTVVRDPSEPGRWSRDPDDDYLVGLALAAERTYS